MKQVKKVWGKESWVVNNREYCGKLLEVDKGAKSSFHRHRKKRETFYCLNGRVILTVKNEKHVLIPENDAVTIERGQWHKFIGYEDSMLLEVSTHHSDEDVERKSESEVGNG
ncbi:hypothetical protein LCGC14_2377010 [marine sediment metagenome]|uniref:Cupin type-2 domain-containing protein n=1 Tax=marine sediment metagenome TaxID=412755 RepID=A0A0F9EEI5_9ZZZZ